MAAATHNLFREDRAETRFIVLNGEPQSELPAFAEERMSSDPVSTSVYFGYPDAPDSVPDGGSLRFRFRSEQAIPDHQPVHGLSADQPGVLELKQYLDDGPRNRKLSLHGLTLGRATEMLATPEGMTELSLLAGGVPFAKAVYQLFGGRRPVPFQMTQANRRQFAVHYPGMPARVTYDSRTTFWWIGHDPGQRLTFAARCGTLPFKILEIKTEAPIDPEGSEATQIVDGLFGANAVYQWVTRIKRAAARGLCDSLGPPALHNPGLEKSQDDRYFYEQEIKIDTSEDPRTAVAAIGERPLEGVFMPRGFTSDMRFRIRTYGDGTPVIEKAYDDDFRDSFFQVKTGVKSEAAYADVLTRHETTAKSIDLLWRKLGWMAVGDYTTTPTAIRHRLARPLICEKTGNVFVVLADHCTAADGRPPLEQAEIEYLGTLGFAHNLGNATPEAIAADFALLHQLVVKAIGSNKVLPHATTKQDWIAANGFEADAT